MYTIESYNKFCAILAACISSGIPLELREANEVGQVVAFRLDGFSKSSTATVTYNPKLGLIEVTTRYDRLDYINNYDDLVNIAWSWYINYVDVGYHIPQNFVKDFIRLGYIEERVKTEYVIKH